MHRVFLTSRIDERHDEETMDNLDFEEISDEELEEESRAGIKLKIYSIKSSLVLLYCLF